MLAALSAVVALGCIVASTYRLRAAVTPTPLDPDLLSGALQRDGGAHAIDRLREALAGAPDLAWEHDLLAAFAEGDVRLREALVSEQLTDLEGRADRYGRVPRVCASIATSAGFLFASVWLLGAVTAPGGVDSLEAVQTTLIPALDALAIGVAGTFFCAAVHVRAGRASRHRMGATDRLTETLRSLGKGGNASADAAGAPVLEQVHEPVHEHVRAQVPA